MRCAILILAVAALDAAEVARRDLMLAVDSADGAFDYTLGTAIGDFHGSDAFDSMRTVRLGGRWAWTAAGRSLAPLLGGDLELTDAPMPDGGMRGYGASLAAGCTWALGDRLALDGEGFIGMQQVALDLQSSGGTSALDAAGRCLRDGLRLRLLWHPAPRWSLGIEGSWTAWSGDLGADAGRDLSISGGGLGAGLVLAWRPSSRPGGVE